MSADPIASTSRAGMAEMNGDAASHTESGGLYLVDYGAGNVQSLANSLTKLGYAFRWVREPGDFDRAEKLIFPGVGAFGPAMRMLRERGFVEPLKRYIASGRPYMGICIGLQTLFEGSDEAAGEPGLGILPGRVRAFSRSTKAVPHMGWNGSTPLQSAPSYGIEDGACFYFVHTYRVLCSDTMPEAILGATRYGDETFVSAVRHRNVFGTQFHPEKSGAAGLALLRAWLSQSGSRASFEQSAVADRAGAISQHGFTKRIVACLDVRANDSGDLVVTKGDQYDVREATGDTRAVRNLGKPVELARRYYAEGADEICFLNITSFRNSPLRDQPMLDVVRKAAETIFVPLTIGGGIRDSSDPDGTPRSALDVASAYFRAGADKVSIGGDAVLAVEQLLASGGVRSGQTGIETISLAYGCQAVVVSIDPRRVYALSIDQVPSSHRDCVADLAATDELEADLGPDGERYCWWQCTVQGGRAVRDIDAVQLARGAQTLGAGEILLNSVDRDGSKRGFDARLVSLVRGAVSIPVVASSGAGSVRHFSELFERTDVEAGLAAGIFHRREVPLTDVKAHLRASKIPVRTESPSLLPTE